MRNYTTIQYVSGIPSVRMICTLPAAPAAVPVPPEPPEPPVYYLISGTVTEDGTGFSAPLEFTGLGTFSSAASGSYGHVVVGGYSGTVIPHSYAGTFVPEYRVYTSVGTDYPEQDYAFFAAPVPEGLLLISGVITSFDLPVTDTIDNGTNIWMSDNTTGSYGFLVPTGWSGTTICNPLDFPTPPSYVYVNVVVDTPNQDFAVLPPT